MPEWRLRFRVSILKLIKNCQPNNVLNYHLEYPKNHPLRHFCSNIWFYIPCRLLSASTLAIFWGSPIRRTTSVLSIARTITFEDATTDAWRIASFMISENLPLHKSCRERQAWFLKRFLDWSRPIRQRNHLFWAFQLVFSVCLHPLSIPTTKNIKIKFFWKYFTWQAPWRII